MTWLNNGDHICDRTGQRCQCWDSELGPCAYQRTNHRPTSFVAVAKQITTSYEWLGCMTETDFRRCWFNGSTPDRAKPAAKTPTLLEQLNISPIGGEAAFIKFQAWCLDQYAPQRADARRALLANRTLEFRS